MKNLEALASDKDPETLKYGPSEISKERIHFYGLIERHSYETGA